MRWLVDVLLLSDTATVSHPVPEVQGRPLHRPGEVGVDHGEDPFHRNNLFDVPSIQLRRARGKVAVGGPSGSVPCPAYPFMNRVRLLLGEKGCLPPLPPLDGFGLSVRRNRPVVGMPTPSLPAPLRFGSTGVVNCGSTTRGRGIHDRKGSFSLSRNAISVPLRETECAARVKGCRGWAGAEAPASRPSPSGALISKAA
jgi:hypothetical protein